MKDGGRDWDPGAYARFRDLRLRPALDLLIRVEAPPAGAVVDLGCGDGAVGPALRARFPKRRLLGIDGSAAMLAQARGYDATERADIAAWAPAEPVAVLYSNAALHWLGRHEALLPRLLGLVVPGGTLAVQMPRQFEAPSHRLLRDLAAEMFPGRFPDSAPGRWVAPVAPPAAYHRLLAPLARVEAWETEYLQPLAPVAEGHPVRAFTQSTTLRPYAERLAEGELAEFLAAYDDALAIAYPAEADGTVLFPFRRLFLIAVRPL